MTSTDSTQLVEKREVLVVGAGPAGSSAALRLAESGFDVLVVDKRRIVGLPAQCGEVVPNWGEVSGIFPRLKGDSWLEEAWRFPSRLVHQQLDTMRVFTPKLKEYSFPFDGFSSDRVQFDSYLADIAIAAGVEYRLSSPLRGMRRDEDGSAVWLVGTTEVSAQYVIDASGPRSVVTSMVGGATPRLLIPTIYAHTEPRNGELPSTFDLWFGSVALGGYAWLIPQGARANVGIGVRPNTNTEPLKALLTSFIESLGHDILGWGGGMIPMSGPIRQMVHENVISVGDAAGLTMASNGGGVPQAIISGKLASDAIIGHRVDGTPLTTYQKHVMRAMGGPLKNAVRSKLMMDITCRNDFLTEGVMRFLGPIGGLRRAIECKRPLWLL